MSSRRTFLTGVAGLAVAGGSYSAGAFREARAQADTRLHGLSSLIDTSAGALEYAVAGDGPTCMMIHGTGGGFDQGLLFAATLRHRGHQVIAPSRFGYLRSAFPDDASPAHQADVLVELLDHLGLDRIPVVGGSAGALTAAEFALRHPDRCSHLVLLVPAANLTNRNPVAFTALQRLAVGAVLGSDWWFWTLSKITRRQMLRTLLATDPVLLDKVVPQERQRAEVILSQLFPISRKIDGLRTDGYWAGTPSKTSYERVTAPTLIVSCEDDFFGTAATARLLAKRIPQASLIIFPTGGHIWLGHDADIAGAISEFVRGVADPDQ
ncbi:alpha/beta fold hydrolase [Sulfitobacter sp. MF3-043]|uniref:alpha/beta fold hydrolase n=1 Tax=Sulfitobacter sediminivivens TaxID=3252902 RepID=UPI0036DB4F3E